MQCLVMIVAGVGIGTGVAHALQDRLPSGTAAALTEPRGAQPTGLGGAAPAASVLLADPLVQRFAWSSTCDVAMLGLGRGGAADVSESIRIAHDHVALFAAGIVPDDVRGVLDEAYATVVLGTAGGDAAVTAGLAGSIGEVCAAWSARIPGAG